MWVGSDYGCCKQNEICPKFGHALIGKEVKRNEPPNHKFLGLKGKMDQNCSCIEYMNHVAILGLFSPNL